MWCVRLTLFLVALGGIDARRLRRRGSAATRAQTCAKLRQSGVYYDGWSRMGCDTDISPAKQRLYFKDHACVGMPPGSSCRLQTMPMTPTLCFDFCRQHEAMKFFGIEYGRDCYCTGYVHAKSTGGGGCDLPCEGDAKEICGGAKKSSTFEMHFCDSSADDASLASEQAAEAIGKAQAAGEKGKQVSEMMKTISTQWQLGGCSVAEHACGLPETWTASANELFTTSQATEQSADVTAKAGTALEEASAAVKEAGEEVTGELQGKMEAATTDAKAKAVKTSVATSKVENLLKSLGGPISAAEEEDPVPQTFWEEGTKLFRPLGDVEKNWHAICDLEPIANMQFEGTASHDDPTRCAKKCLETSTGTEACVAFNYQFYPGASSFLELNTEGLPSKKGGLPSKLHDLQGGGASAGLMSCQLLTENGLTKPSISKAVPIFEISKSKIDDMKFASVDCYAKNAFMDSHPSGALKPDVKKKLIVK